jgi:trk system potassium uptake protein TrkH
MFNLQPILLVNGILLMILSLAMLIPAAIDAATGHNDWQAFLIAAFFSAFMGGSLYFSNRGFSGHLTIRQTFLFTTSSWFILPIFAALPFLFASTNLSFTDAYFESVSGLTTTGATILIGLDTIPSGILLWRSILQGLGGVGVIVLAMAVLPMLRIGGMQLFRTESSDKMEKILPRAGQIARVIGITYVSLTLLCTIAYWSFGMNGFDALCHAITTIGTAGFSTHDASIGFYNSIAIELIAMAGMLAGAVPMILYYQAIRGKPLVFWRDAQVRWFFGIVIFSIIFMSIWLFLQKSLPLEYALRAAAFNVISIITTTGYASADYAQWGTGATVFLFMLLVVGGCTGSTAGGIKIFRFQVLFASARTQLQQLIQPHAILIPRYEHRPISENVSASVLGFFTLFAFCFMVLAVLLSMFGLNFLTSMSAAAQALANVGPGLGQTIGPSGSYASLPAGAKWLIAFAMIVGRLELFTILVLFTNRFWRD